MQNPDPSTPKKLVKTAAEKVVAALNRADELGGEVRDWIQERVVVDPRYVAARKRLAQLLGKEYVAAADVAARAQAAEAARAAAAPAPVAAAAPKGLGNPKIKAQIYGKKSCPWTGRAITLLEQEKVDYDYVNLEDPDYESLHPQLMRETSQNTVPYVYLRGQFIGGYNALAEIARLGQLDVAMMTPEEKANAPAHLRSIVITARPERDEVAPGENAEPVNLPAE